MPLPQPPTVRIPVASVDLANTHRLIPAKYSRSGTVLSRLTDDEQMLDELLELDGATNDRLLGEEGLLPGIGVHELVYGIDYAHIVNAAFTHAAPDGGRFNSSERGAWYAGLERETSLAEVAFHKQRQLEEVAWPEDEIAIFDDYVADFTMPAHDLTSARPQFRKYLRPEPIPECYAEPQALASDLMARQSNGILYPSVRRDGGQCLVCFRPALVYNVRRGKRLQFTVRAGEPFREPDAREISIREK
ncbi:MAG TPA: RES family NAD+ phosphorylase [Acidobacteriaceae bacterium]|jgi:RES domain-containing protein|nr:RES family NAD+ phosphorylase [Acidobacteriaceae bacterium]